jgi:hypothetical protein
MVFSIIFGKAKRKAFPVIVVHGKGYGSGEK